MEKPRKTWEPINFVFYLSFIKWPIIFAIVAEIGSRWLASNFWPDLPWDRVDLYMWLIRLTAFIFIGWKIGKTYGEVPPMGAIAGLIGGLFIGLAIALSRFSSGFQVWKLFNVVTESALTILAGGLAAFLIVYVWDMLPDKIRNFKINHK